MRDKLVVIGAGGHSKVCQEIAKLNGYKTIIVLDDNPDNLSAYGKTELFTDFIEDSDFFVAIGNNKIRKEIIEKIIGKQGTLTTLIHPNAVVSEKVNIGDGTVVMAGAVINPGARVGNGVIVNTCSSVDHDCQLDSYCHIGVGAHLAGTVHIQEGTFIGAGTIIINNITIHKDVIVGAGATVISDICERGTYVGLPAKKIK